MTRRPNILWIQTDEQRPDSLGCYNSEWAKTPNLDRLATGGTVFHECHVQSPLCLPSRTLMLMGRYPQGKRRVLKRPGLSPIIMSGLYPNHDGGVTQSCRITDRSIA